MNVSAGSGRSWRPACSHGWCDFIDLRLICYCFLLILVYFEAQIELMGVSNPIAIQAEAMWVVTNIGKHTGNRTGPPSTTGFPWTN